MSGVPPSDDFSRAIDFSLKWEGGLSDDPDDPGGITKFGISFRAHRHLGREGIKNLTIEQAAEIYHAEYWKPIAGDELPWPLNLAVFDAAINTGVKRALTFLARANVSQKGPKEKGQIVCNVRRAYYSNIVYKNPKMAKYMKGWTNRVKALERVIAAA